MTSSMKGWSSEAGLMTSKGKKSALLWKSGLFSSYCVPHSCFENQPPRSSKNITFFFKSQGTVDTQFPSPFLGIAQARYPQFPCAHGRTGTHLFLLFLRMVHAVFAFQIIYNTGSDMQYLTHYRFLYTESSRSKFW